MAPTFLVSNRSILSASSRTVAIVDPIVSQCLRKEFRHKSMICAAEEMQGVVSVLFAPSMALQALRTIKTVQTEA